MSTNATITDEDGDPVEHFTATLPLDRATLSWLARMSTDDADAARKIATMLKMIREDDEQAEPTVLH